ncbi:MAG: aminotransferase class I/II-fold pyridoxal phosphate-dependent enzyme [Woeseiaceae bacterium]|nr:aminotransferase class I/II-fold pyridoxal phosphate-dependent enzyme [Woeseiaceae bacterium]
MAADRKKYGINTEAVHAGEARHTGNRPSAPDIVMSSTFVVDEEVSFSANNLTEDTPWMYTRWGNPTTRELEERLAVLENAEDCIAFASGMAATTALLFQVLGQGDHLVIANTNYPGTAEFARDTLMRYGVDVTPVNTNDLANVENAMRPETKLVWIETPSNPLLRIADIEGISKIAKAHGALLAVDSTFATPIATRPLDLGADFVVHSLTKAIGGHGDAMGGSVCGSKELMAPLRSEGLSHYGGVISPFNAWLILRGIATLPMRMQAHEQNAMALANFLEQHPRVDGVIYPGLASHSQHELAARQMDNFGGMISFRVADGKALAERMMQQLEVIHYAVSLGHHRSLVYRMLTDELALGSYALEGEELESYRALAGDGLFRFSVGIEDAEDLIADLDRVL